MICGAGSLQLVTVPHDWLACGTPRPTKTIFWELAALVGSAYVEQNDPSELLNILDVCLPAWFLKNDKLQLNMCFFNDAC